MQVPVEKLGSQVTGFLSNLSQSDLSNTSVHLSVNIQGNYANPKVGLAGGDNLQNYLTNALKSRVSSATDQVKQEVAAEFKMREDSIKQELKAKAEVAKDSAKSEAEKIINQTKDKAVDELRGLLKGFGSRNRAKPDTVQ